jgi:phytoene synthase
LCEETGGSSVVFAVDGERTGAQPVPLAPVEHQPTVDTMLSRADSENFPVASRLLPRSLRRHLFALYGFARLVDYAGDEAPGDRTALLNVISTDVGRLYHGMPRVATMRRLAGTVRECGIPREPLDRLIEANHRDQRVRRYETFDELLDYCTCSANPVGELVLHVFGRATPARIGLSDRICTALQILEHCQDVAEDHAAGRIYLPAEDLARDGCSETELAAPTASPALRRVIALQTRRASRLLDEGEPLIGRLPLLARIAVSGYIAGGRATAAAIAAADHDVLYAAIRPRRGRLLREWLRLAVRGGAR